jgi:hypothetical protein
MQYTLVLLGLKWSEHQEHLNLDWFIIRNYWCIFGGFLLVQLPDFALFWCHICKARIYTTNKYYCHKKPPPEYTVKKGWRLGGFPVPSRDVTYQTLPGQE